MGILFVFKIHFQENVAEASATSFLICILYSKFLCIMICILYS